MPNKSKELTNLLDGNISNLDFEPIGNSTIIDNTASSQATTSDASKQYDSGCELKTSRYGRPIKQKLSLLSFEEMNVIFHKNKKSKPIKRLKSRNKVIGKRAKADSALPDTSEVDSSEHLKHGNEKELMAKSSNDSSSSHLAEQDSVGSKGSIVTLQNCSMIPHFLKHLMSLNANELSSNCIRMKTTNLHGVCNICKFPEKNLIVKNLNDYQEVFNSSSVSLGLGLASGGVTTCSLLLRPKKQHESFCPGDAFLIGIVVRGIGKLLLNSEIVPIAVDGQNSFSIGPRSYFAIINESNTVDLETVLLQGSNTVPTS